MHIDINTGYLFVSIFSTCPGRPQPQAEYLGSLIFSIMKTQHAHGHATLTLYMSLIFLHARDAHNFKLKIREA